MCIVLEYVHYKFDLATCSLFLSSFTQKKVNITLVNNLTKYFKLDYINFQHISKNNSQHLLKPDDYIQQLFAPPKFMHMKKNDVKKWK